MSTDTEVGTISVERILELVNDSKVVLPEFQRSFVWGDEQVASLLVSMLKGWPAGTFLFSEIDDPTRYVIRGFQGGPAVDPLTAQYLVLDGQQRITGLYEVLRDTSERVWALEASQFDRRMGPEELRDIIRVFSPSQWRTRDLHGGRRGEPLWVPFHALASRGSFFRWRNDVSAESLALSSPANEPADLRVTLTAAYAHGLDQISKYEFPLVLTNKDLDPGSVARIFERMNSSGLSLNTFDLVVAHSFDEKWNLRGAWKAALLEFPRVRDFFEEDGLAPIEVLSLSSSGSVRREQVLNLEPELIRTSFSRAVNALDRAIALCETFGVRKPEFLPHRSFVIVIAAILFSKLRLSEAHLKYLRAWFFSRAITQRYSLAVNTRIASDYAELRTSMAEHDNPVLAEMRVDQAELRRASGRSASSLLRAFICVLASNDAEDVPVGLFPIPGDARQVGAASVLPPPFSGRVLGYVLVSAPRTIDQIELWSVIRGDDSASNQFRRSQLIGAGHLLDTPENFLRERSRLLREWLQQICGYDVLQDEWSSVSD